MRYGCGCVRGHIKCEAIEVLYGALETAFRTGLSTGDWDEFSFFKVELELHYKQGTIVENEISQTFDSTIFVEDCSAPETKKVLPHPAHLIRNKPNGRYFQKKK